MQLVSALTWLTSLAAAACGGGDDESEPAGTCLQTLNLAADCTPSLNPTWPQIYNNILVPTCGKNGTGGSCHGEGGKQGGLGLYDMTLAYEDLLGMSGDHARVLPGDPKCSLLLERLETDNLRERMPLGAANKLSEGYRCAIQRWIEDGAAPE